MSLGGQLVLTVLGLSPHREGGGKKKERKKDQEGGEHNLGLELEETALDAEAAKRTVL